MLSNWTHKDFEDWDARLAGDDVREFGFLDDDRDDMGDDILDDTRGSCFASDESGDWDLDADSHSD